MKSYFLVVLCATFLICIRSAFAQLPGETRDLGGNRLGSNPCTFGPSYWCASPQNAARCGGGAVGFCLRTGQFQGNGQPQNDQQQGGQQQTGQQQQQPIAAVPLIGFASPFF